MAFSNLKLGGIAVGINPHVTQVGPLRSTKSVWFYQKNFHLLRARSLCCSLNFGTHFYTIANCRLKTHSDHFVTFFTEKKESPFCLPSASRNPHASWISYNCSLELTLLAFSPKGSLNMVLASCRLWSFSSLSFFCSGHKISFLIFYVLKILKKLHLLVLLGSHISHLFFMLKFSHNS